MPHPFDAASKHMIHGHPADWLALAGLPAADVITGVDADLSVVSTAADKLLRVGSPAPYIAHFEFQASADSGLDGRVLLYNALARQRLGLPVRSVVLLLRPQAQTTGVTGRVQDVSVGDHRFDFGYQMVRVWELRPDRLLAGGLGTLPLAPISGLNESELPTVIAAMDRRLENNVPPAESQEIWTAAKILMGLRWSKELTRLILQGVRNMKESVTYQEIVEEGIVVGVEKGRVEGRVEEIKKILLRGGGMRFGPAEASAKARIEALADLGALEEMLDRLLMGLANSWDELISPIA